MHPELIAARGGKYLVLPPGYDGPVPEGGFFVARSKTTRVLWFGRSFMENKSDPKPVAELIKKATKIYPYEAGGFGTPIAEFLSGKVNLGRAQPATDPGSTGTARLSARSHHRLPTTSAQQIVRRSRRAPSSELMGPIAAIARQGQAVRPRRG